MVAKSKKVEKKLINGPKEVFYATLGMQKTAYELSVEKYNELTEKRKSDLEDFIKRGEEVEALFRDKYEDFKASENLVAKGVISAEEQYKKLSEMLNEISDKVKSFGKDSKMTKPARKVVKTTRKTTRKAASKVTAKAKTVKKTAAKKVA